MNWQGGGGFRFYHLGEATFDEDRHINPDIRFVHLAAHIWFSETRSPYTGRGNSPLLGIHNGVAYYLLYNGILGDKLPIILFQSENKGQDIIVEVLEKYLVENEGIDRTQIAIATGEQR